MAQPPFSSLAEALQWLDGHVDFEASMPDRRSLPTLDRVVNLMSVLGDPHLTMPTIHLTGTNGKGSTAAMVTSLLMANGLSVGTYTSPNLSRVNERLARNAEPIDDETFRDVLATLAALEPMVDGRLTRFELLTAAALAWFADEAVDAMVIEVGLGGTWDCTNVVHADVAVLTNISFDHTEVLGPTLEGIARDKAGIIKSGSRVVVGETNPELVAVITEAADLAQAEFVWTIGRDFDCTSNRLAVGGRLVDLVTPGARYGELLVPFHGPHQGVNAACALAAVEAFFDAPLDEEVAEEGFGAAKIAGRLEVLSRHPLCLVDGAHNVAGMQALGRSIAEEFDVEGERVAVVGMLSGRDPSAMLAPLARAGVKTIVACAPDSPRALGPEVVAEAARSEDMSVVVATSVTDAMAQARRLVGEDGMILVAGSLYVVATAREWLLETAPRP